MMIRTISHSLILFGIILYFTTDTTCNPVKRFIFTVNCSETITCDAEDITYLCATDDKTYDNDCHLRAINLERSCVDGVFDPIVKVHDGNCTDTTTVR